MRTSHSALLCLAMTATLTLASAGDSFAQRAPRSPGPGVSTGKPSGSIGQPSFPGNYTPLEPDNIMAIPQHRPDGAQYRTMDSGSTGKQTKGSRRQPERTARGDGSVPTANEGRSKADEVLFEVSNVVNARTVEDLLRRFRLVQIASQSSQLLGTTVYRGRISDGRPPAAVVRALEAESVIAQQNHLFTLQEYETETTGAAAGEGGLAQYELAKLRLPEAHRIANGQSVLVAVLDTAIDAAHPDLAGSIAKRVDVVGTPMTPHRHGTAIAGLIAAHGKLTGAAPAAQILAVRAFDPAGAGAEGSTFDILKGLDWAAANGARVINMSFAGPRDAALHRAMEAAHKQGIVLVAAVGNAGAKSPPLYPAADPNVIAVAATDADDGLLEESSRGHHIALAAPGAKILVAIPGGGYEVASGTSYSAAEISGIVALMLEHKSGLTPDKVRAILLATAKDLGPKGRDTMFGAGLADAYGAILAEDAPAPRAAERVSTGAR